MRAIFGQARAERLVSPGELQDFWRAPAKRSNAPEDYARLTERSETLTSLVGSFLPDRGAELLEVGCNVGRDREALRSAGYSRPSAVEISAEAVAALGRHYPELAASAEIGIGAAETLLPARPDASKDLVFSPAVLLHLHPDSAAVFSEMVRITRKYLIAIEYEGAPSYRIYSRDCRRVFEDLGM